MDHVAIAVHSIEESRGLFELLSGDACSTPEILEDQGVRVALVGTIELLEPLGPDTTVGRFLARRGQALHHIAYCTNDLEDELARLEAAGVQLIDRTPRPGAYGHMVAFLHPSSAGGILTELVQRTE
jgi:methylmalonyl-CoA/ethylmalonyl-CoA epimerase